jgi:ABC-type proline/glycine betaine transport system ATPase subunit
LFSIKLTQAILSHPANSFVEDFFHSSMVNNFYETPVSQACLLLKLNPKPHNLSDNLIMIDERISLAQVLQLLSKAKEIRIQDQNNKCQGYIDHQWLIEYLNIIRINK